MLAQSYLTNAGLDLTIRRTAVAAIAAERYRRDHGGEAPASFDALVPEYLDRVPLNPYSGTALKYRRDSNTYGFGSGNPNRMLPRGSVVLRDIGIRVH